VNRTIRVRRPSAATASPIRSQAYSASRTDVGGCAERQNAATGAGDALSWTTCRSSNHGLPRSNSASSADSEFKGPEAPRSVSLANVFPAGTTIRRALRPGLLVPRAGTSSTAGTTSRSGHDQHFLAMTDSAMDTCRPAPRPMSYGCLADNHPVRVNEGTVWGTSRGPVLVTLPPHAATPSAPPSCKRPLSPRPLEKPWVGSRNPV